jgi:hypothetical protein
VAKGPLVGEEKSEGDDGADEGVKGDEGDDGDAEDDRDDAGVVAVDKTGCSGTDRRPSGG